MAARCRAARSRFPETRELDRLAQLLTEEGATTLRCPLVAIKDAPDQRPVEAWLRALAAGGMDDVIFLTGEGLRRLLAAAERIGLRAEVVAALGRARKITRGPKPARALHEIGLSSDLPARGADVGRRDRRAARARSARPARRRAALRRGAEPAAGRLPGAGPAPRC